MDRARIICSHVALEGPTGSAGGATSVLLKAASCAERRAKIDIYLDFRSIDAYLSLASYEHLGRHFEDCSVTLRPYPLLSKVRGGTEVGFGDGSGGVDVSSVGTHWQLKHPCAFAAYMAYSQLKDCPLVIPESFIETSILQAGLLYALHRGSTFDAMLEYSRRAFDTVFTKADVLGIKEVASVQKLLFDSIGNPALGFADWWAQEGEMALAQERSVAETRGVFTAPTCTIQKAGDSAWHVFVGELGLPLAWRALGAESSAIPSLLWNAPPPQTPDRIPRDNQRPYQLDVYIDVKSPYAYLALAPTQALERDFNVRINWLPFPLDITSYLGSAEVGAKDNKVKPGTNKRSPAQWNMVKYAYMDARRYAHSRRPSLQIFGTRKIWDTVPWAAAMLWCKDQGADVLARFADALWPAFWRREVDIEDAALLEIFAAKAGANTAGFADWVAGQGRERALEIRKAATKLGVFGVPSYSLGDGDGVALPKGAPRVLFGREHLILIRRYLLEMGFARRSGVDADMPFIWEH